MEVEVLKPGLATTIQDLGRTGFGEFGVPVSGVMDSYSAKFANILLGNDENAAVMEIYLQGPMLKFHGKTFCAVSGPGAEIHLNGKHISCNETFSMKKDDVLEIKKTERSRVYLSVSGGFQTEIVMGSRSMYEGITQKSIIQKGDILKFNPVFNLPENTFSAVHFNSELYSGNILTIFPGPEFDLLSEKTKTDLLQRKFTISKDANRMAYPLSEPLENVLKNILTGPVLPGTLQLTPSGKLIILMRDCQTTGGYPRVLQLSEKSQNLLAQKKPSDEIGFEIIQPFQGLEP